MKHHYLWFIVIVVALASFAAPAMAGLVHDQERLESTGSIGFDVTAQSTLAQGAQADFPVFVNLGENEGDRYVRFQLRFDPAKVRFVEYTPFETDIREDPVSFTITPAYDGTGLTLSGGVNEPQVIGDYKLEGSTLVPLGTFTFEIMEDASIGNSVIVLENALISASQEDFNRTGEVNLAQLAFNAEFRIVAADAGNNGNATNESNSGDQNNTDSGDNLTDNERKVQEMHTRFDDLENEYRDARDDYREAQRDDDSRDLRNAEDDLENIDEDLDDLDKDVDNLIDDLKDEDRSANRDSIEDLEDLQDDIKNLQEKISDLIDPSDSSAETGNTYVPSTTQNSQNQQRVAAAPVERAVEVQQLNTLPGAVPSPAVTEETMSWETVRMVAWIVAGIVVLLAVIVFLIAALLR